MKVLIYEIRGKLAFVPPPRTWYNLQMSQRAKIFSLVAFLFLLLATLPTPAKVATDFDPTLNFSRYKTFAYLGGTEMLLRMQLNPDQLNNQIHRSVARELTAKGLREVQPESHPDLVVRYWIETQSVAGVGYGASWSIYGTYWTGHWSVQYISMHTNTPNEGTIGIELIDANTKGLAWRMYATQKIIHIDSDKIWKSVDSSIKKGFKAYQPSPEAIAAKKTTMGERRRRRKYEMNKYSPVAVNG